MNKSINQSQSSYFSYQPIDQGVNVSKKRRVQEILQQITASPLDKLDESVQAGYHRDAIAHVTHPINELVGVQAIYNQVWLPIHEALPDMERRDDILAAGMYRDDHWIACLGHYAGTFKNDLLGIPATQGVVALRFAEGHHIQGEKITRSYLFFDFLDLIRQAGFWPISPSLGKEMNWLPPRTHDGVILSPQDQLISKNSIERVLKMHQALGNYNGKPPTRDVLDQMKMVKHWHPNFMWYGPAGIGTTRGLAGFEDYHQIPFLVAFPDRKGTGDSHFIRIGDGHYAVTGGWGYLQATHTGDNFLGVPATGKRVQMRVMDFYRCDDETIIENWVPFDIPHLLLQMGVDIFGRMRHQFRQHQAIRVSDWLL